MTMRLTFEIGTDVDIAQVQTQNRQRLAEPQLPDEVIRQGITVKKTSPDLLAVIALSSTDPAHDTIFLSNYALLRVLDNVKRLPGVGDAIIFGGQNYSMRIILDPVRMAQLNITPTEIAAVVRETESGLSSRKNRPRAYAARNRTHHSGHYARPDERSQGIRGHDRSRLSGRLHGSDAGCRACGIGCPILRPPGAMEWKTQYVSLDLSRPRSQCTRHRSTSPRRKWTELAKTFPPGVSYDIPYDTTIFIEVSIKEVVKTLIEAMLLVILVVFLFLQSWRATLIPAVAVPISLIGTLAGMEALGFSINTLTLFGMVLAIGIVVDDAIVVVENVERHMTQDGLSPKDAAKKAMDEVSGPVIAIVLVLAAVFVPVAIFGRHYRRTV